MNSEHIIKGYDEELGRLNDTIDQMGRLAGSQLSSAIDAVVNRDGDLAAQVVAADPAVDQLERDLDSLALRLLALQQPMARDLREVFVAVKVGSDLERMSDYAVNVAKRAIALNQVPSVEPTLALPRMAQLAQSMISDIRDAWIERDAEKALAVWRRDEELDAMYSSFFRELLTYMMEDPRTIGSCTHLLFIAKNIERIGDHATNIAENLYFLVHGTPLGQPRPKGDSSNLAVVPPGRSEVVP